MENPSLIGYSHLTSEAKVTAVLVDGNLVGSAGAEEEVEIVLDRTPFYAEGGGRVS